MAITPPLWRKRPACAFQLILQTRCSTFVISNPDDLGFQIQHSTKLSIKD